jgi:hypothetical protein
MLLSHESLANMLQVNFVLIQKHHYSLTEIENLIPWERDVYLGLLQKDVAEENKRIAKLQSQRK